jgi:hypothetical protein
MSGRSPVITYSHLSFASRYICVRLTPIKSISMSKFRAMVGADDKEGSEEGAADREGAIDMLGDDDGAAVHKTSHVTGHRPSKR